MDPHEEAAGVARRLATLGIPESAARAYACLLIGGTMKASALADAAGISRHEAYRDLTVLIRQGLASATLTRPMMYVPADPQDALQMLYRRSKRQAEMVRSESLHLAPLLHEIRSPPDGKSEWPLRIIDGRQRAYEYLHEMLSNALHEMLVINTHPAAAQLAADTGLWQRVQQRADVDLQIRILLCQDSGIARHASMVRSKNCQIRLIDLEEVIRFAIADQHNMLFFTSADASPREEASDSAFSTTSPAFVQMENGLFWRLWDEAKPLAQ